MKNQKLLFKLLIISGLVIGSLIPLQLIKSIIFEREDRLNEVEKEISRSWGSSQEIAGPVLIIPYKYWIASENVKDTTQKNDENNYEIRNFYLLPDELKIHSFIDPQIRYRDIYRVVVYSTELDFKGTFKLPDFADIKIKSEDILWNDAAIIVYIPDMRGIKKEIECIWTKHDTSSVSSETLAFLPIISFKSGIGLALPELSPENSIYQFNFSLGLNGSKSLSLAPIGKSNTFDVKSSWKTPSFSGSYLPTMRKINKKGFESKWEISYFGRDYPQFWKESDDNEKNIWKEIRESSPEISLLVPVDVYQETTRSVKYGILFISLTFLAFFLIEILTGLKVHPMQYILVGLALSLFYLLLISLSEQWDFFPSFLIASLSNIILITLYVISIMRSISKGLVLGGILIFLYTFLYILLQIESYALLAGSSGLFLILALVMYLTRKIDWYNINKDSTEKN